MLVETGSIGEKGTAVSAGWKRTYCGAAPAPENLLESWNGDPFLLLALAGLATWILVSRHGLERRWLLAGWAVLAVLFVSPLCSLTSALFSARSAHHLVLVSVAAPLIAYGLGDRGQVRLRIGPIAAAGVHAATFWFWHVPALYEAALGHVAVYWLMQATLLGSAVLVWRRILIPRAGLLPALLALVGLILQMGFLGAVLTFAREPLYTPHLLTTAPWRLSPLEDQQLAGLLMWAPGMLPYLYAALRMTMRALAFSDIREGPAWSRS